MLLFFVLVIFVVFSLLYITPFRAIQLQIPSSLTPCTHMRTLRAELVDGQLKFILQICDSIHEGLWASVEH